MFQIAVSCNDYCHNSGPQDEGSFLLSMQPFELENISYSTVIVTSFIGLGAYSQSSLIQLHGFNDTNCCILSVLKKNAVSH